MEIIKKKISLENFKSRIPSLFKTIDDEGKNSWGKIVKSVFLFDKNITYQSFMKLYYSLMNIIMFSSYYEYDKKIKLWISKECDWRDIFNNSSNVFYFTNFPEEDIDVYQDKIIGITSEKNVNIFYNKTKKITNDTKNAFELIDIFHNIMGKKIVPYMYRCNKCGNYIMNKDNTNITTCTIETCKSKNIEHVQEKYVPYFVYISELEILIENMEKLKNESTMNCCKQKEYIEHGGDVFLDYLKELKNDGEGNNDRGIEFKIPDITIPILLINNYMDLGEYKTDNADIIIDNNKINRVNNNYTNQETKVLKTSGLSKIRTLMKRTSFDDNGNQLPTIVKEIEGKYETFLPYEVDYIKNVQIIGDKYYGDSVKSLTISQDGKECTEGEFNKIYNKLSVGYKNICVGTIKNPLTNIQNKEIKVDYNYNTNNLSLNVNDTIEKYKKNIKDELIEKIKVSGFYCYKQEYKIIITVGNKVSEEEGFIYIVHDNPQIEIQYVIGGELVLNKNEKYVIKETNPFTLTEDELNKWNGNGMWYKEKLPIKRLTEETIQFSGETVKFFYDKIDFESVEKLDNTKNKHIFCEEIIYKPQQYINDCTNDFVFKDEKSCGLNFPLKEKYDVVIDRGSVSAFEKHLQLTDIKTWEDLENYRNGMFLGK